MQDVEISIVMPCLNEEETIAKCIAKANRFLSEENLLGEVIISDNGSTDRSLEIAQSLGAQVVHQSLKGYGHALRKGIEAARGRYIIIGDSDDSYDFYNLRPFLEKLWAGYDIVMGSRLKGKIEPGAMSFLHRLGNPLLTGILNLFFKTGISDAHCGLRAFTKEAFQRMKLKTGGMEFASEFVVKAVKERLKITEVAITLHKAGRTRPPHLRTFADGWRHVRFLLIYSPTYLYLIPGFLLLFTGVLMTLALAWGPLHFKKHIIDFHYNILGTVLSILGLQIVSLGLFSRIYAYINGFDRYDTFIINFIHKFRLYKGIYLGFGLLLVGFSIFLLILAKWILSDFGELFAIRPALIATVLVVNGLQIISSSFFISMLIIDETEI